jgi:GNAT superfamily N-acetyltransferase
MTTPEEHSIAVFGNGDILPSGAEEMFAAELADSRRPFPPERPDRGLWRFALICAIGPGGEVLGGAHLDIGPVNGAGPLAASKLAYLERIFIRPERRRRGIGTRVLRKAIQAVSEAGCLCIRCHNSWDNEAERRLFLRCGFALVDLNDGDAGERSYLAVRPLGGSTPA